MRIQSEGVIISMAKKKQRPPSGYTPEQIKEIQDFFKSNDFTAMMSVDHKPELTGKSAEVFKRAKEIFSQYWLKNLHELGIKRMMKNFTRDYPVKLLQNADADHFIEQVAEMYADPEVRGKAVEQFGKMYEEPFLTGIESYCRNFGRKYEDLTEEEIGFIAEKVADVLNEEFIKVLMLGQQVPEVYDISAQIRTHEDFNKSLPGNYDLINFHNKWTHCKTKLGAPLLFSELSEEEMTGLEGARSFFESADAHTQKEYEEIRDAFANTLNSTDREIYYMREKGYTHAEIAERLGYKTHSAVTKRLKAMQEKYDEFCGNVEAMQKEKQKK